MAAKLFFLQIQHQSRVYQIFIQNMFGLILPKSKSRELPARLEV